MTATVAKASGKTILFGEHAVVYGQPAIAVPLDAIYAKAVIEMLPRGFQNNNAIIVLPNLNITRNFSDFDSYDPIRTAIAGTLDYLGIERLPMMRITITSSIPIAAGLGSSAAIAVATIKAVSQSLGFKLEAKEVNNLAFQVEIIQHGKPSGVDNTTITYNQPLYYIKDKEMEFLEIVNPIPLIIADTGMGSSTKEAVEEVRKRYEKEPEVLTRIFNQIGEISRKAKCEVEKGHLQMIGSLMSQNHRLLVNLGVSCNALDTLVETALSCGAYGAKLCGAGKGGNIIVLASEEHIEKIITALRANGAVNAFLSTIQGTSKF